MHLLHDFVVSSVNRPLATSDTSIKGAALPLCSIDPINGTARTAEQNYIHGLVSKILGYYKTLASQQSLEPSSLVNNTFGGLVDVAIQIPPEDIASKVSVSNFLEFRSDGDDSYLGACIENPAIANIITTVLVDPSSSRDCTNNSPPPRIMLKR